jgi:hypothetical protein
MLAQKLRSSTGISELSETQSLQAVKSMLQVSLQEIAWSRSFLPKSMFVEKKMAGFADVKIHQLHSSETEDAKMFESWMQNISDLLKANRLSSVIFGVHDDISKPDEFSEMFHFHIEDSTSFSKIQTIALCQGSSSTKICTSSSKEEVRSSATSMIRSLETLLGTLPAPSSTQRFMSIKLIARDGNLSSQDFSKESGFCCGIDSFICLPFMKHCQCFLLATFAQFFVWTARMQHLCFKNIFSSQGQKPSAVTPLCHLGIFRALLALLLLLTKWSP